MDLLLHLAVERRDQEEAAALAGAAEEADVVAARVEGERAPGDELAVEAEPFPVLVEAAREVLDHVAVLRGDQHHVGLAVGAVRGHDRRDLAGGARREGVGLREVGLLGVRREVAAEVVGPLAVAERLEALLQPLVEGGVELLGGGAEGLLVELLGPAAQQPLAQRVEELADALLAVARLDELEAGVAHVVDEAPGERLELDARQPRHLVGERRVADHHQVERLPHAAEVVRESLVDPQRQRLLRDAEADAARDQVEGEGVRQLVGDQSLQLVGRLVDRDHHAVEQRLGEGGDALGHERREQVGLLELGVGLVEDDRDRLRHLVLEAGRDLEVRALEVGGEPRQVLLELGVVVDLEVRALVDAPREVVVLDLVLAVVGDVLRRGWHGRERESQDRQQQRAESSHLEKIL